YKVAAADSILSLVTNPRFNPRTYMLLEEKPAFTPGKPPALAKEECEITEYEPDYVKISTKLKESAFVCLTDSYYPAWKAYIDGEQTEVYRAYTALRAVGVPEGEHTIEFVYESEIYNTSKTITYLTVLFIALSFAVGVVYPRVKPGRKDG
ncbi:MAG: YfhO family protein, partial [candidate division Zixibacteria bacterium]|nr:YfhO family protein [candidate division Zixibacteria bacterium]